MYRYALMFSAALLLVACNDGRTSTSSVQDAENMVPDTMSDAADTSNEDAWSDATLEDAANDTSSAQGAADTVSDTMLDAAVDTVPDTMLDAAPSGPFVVWLAPAGDDARS